MLYLVLVISQSNEHFQSSNQSQDKNDGLSETGSNQISNELIDFIWWWRVLQPI